MKPHAGLPETLWIDAMILYPSEYNQIKDTIYARSGMALKGDKMEFVARRVATRMAQIDMQSTRDYCRYLALDPEGSELTELINLIVIGETYFFREFPQLELFAEKILPMIEKKNTGKQLKILSAGCATGEEPYTLAIIAKEILQQPGNWDIQIKGIDINGNAIEKAKAGVYSDHALRETPYVYRDTYFESQDGMYTVIPEIRQMVSFSNANLYDTADMGRFFNYDVVFCRNVLIYFDSDSSARVLANLYKTMRPGGYIFSGLAESIGRQSDRFQMERQGKMLVYFK